MTDVMLTCKSVRAGAVQLHTCRSSGCWRCKQLQCDRYGQAVMIDMRCTGGGAVVAAARGCAALHPCCASYGGGAPLQPHHPACRTRQPAAVCQRPAAIGEACFPVPLSMHSS
jgi:hypothetical protein